MRKGLLPALASSPACVCMVGALLALAWIAVMCRLVFQGWEAGWLPARDKNLLELILWLQLTLLVAAVLAFCVYAVWELVRSGLLCAGLLWALLMLGLPALFLWLHWRFVQLASVASHFHLLAPATSIWSRVGTILAFEVILSFLCIGCAITARSVYKATVLHVQQYLDKCDV